MLVTSILQRTKYLFDLLQVFKLVELVELVQHQLLAGPELLRLVELVAKQSMSQLVELLETIIKLPLEQFRQ
jgi:hypothetical protein